MPGRMPRIASVPLLAALLCALVGCAPDESDSLPAGVEVSVRQNRPDTEDRRLQIRITNGSDAPLTVTAVEFSSPRFADPAPYQKAPSTVRAGGVLDLPVSLPPPVCEASDGTAEVHLDFELDSGRSGSVSVVPDDPLDQLDGISERDCLDHAMEAVAVITEPNEIRVEPVDGRLVAFVDLLVTPSGGPGSFTIRSVDDTVLFGLFDPASDIPVVSLPIGLTVHGDDEPGTLTIPLVPSRCDAHAVAEDKRGTLLPLRVDVRDASGIRYFALSDERKGELYSYLNRACAKR
ncbi:MAG TPA: hypothetical protein VFT01_12120 [Homoserinimonas sp.]|nr:hypothetical protein [Homoserinimonas sp.]